MLRCGSYSYVVERSSVGRNDNAKFLKVSKKQSMRLGDDEGLSVVGITGWKQNQY